MGSWKGNKQKRAKLFSLGRKGPQGSFLCSWEIFMFFLKIQGNFKDSCKDAKVSTPCRYLYSPSFLIALQLSFSRRMGANSSTSREWPFIQLVMGQPWDRVPGGANMDLQSKAAPFPIPQTGQQLAPAQCAPEMGQVLAMSEAWWFQLDTLVEHWIVLT